ncbi:MAG TPA: peptidase M64 N-terminal domain-containing protein, partial [Candidatus Deferrimicrobium sp.]|nr:peptidase M64 N-terminal domain-containing protein [Candidatus Deferrimicrobium sp.]
MRKNKTKSFIWMFLSLLLAMAVQAQVKFDDYFVDQTMRIDYYHMADKTTEFISLDKIYRQGKWAGSLNSPSEPFDNGSYYIKIYDAEAGILLYSKGFNSYCSEYITTEMAANGIKRTFH